MEADKESERTRDVGDVRQLNLLGKDRTGGNKMKIFETADYYVASFFPEAEEVEIDDKTVEKGYKAIIGLQDGHHVIMKVMYDKARYPLDDDDLKARSFEPGTKTMMYYAANIGDCAICKRLDANVDQVTEIRRLNPAPVYSAPVVQPVAPVQPIAQVSTKSPLFDTGNALQNMLTEMLFTTKLNQTGQVATALAIEDPILLQKSMPTTIDGVLDLIGNLTELSQGKGEIYRSPDEVTAYIKAVRNGVKPTTETTVDKKEVPVFRRASTVIIS